MIRFSFELKRLDSIASIERGKFSARPRNDPKFFGGDTPFVQTGDVSSAGSFLRRYSQTLNEEGLKVSRLFPKGTILVTIAANIGESTITEFPIACPDSLVGIIPNNDTNVIWLNYALQMAKAELERRATQGAQKNINLETLRPLLIPTPSKQDQDKIATLISTWDRSIDLNESYIKYLELRKKYLIEHLTTTASSAKKVRLVDVSKILFSNVDKKINEGEQPTKLCNYMDVYRNAMISDSIDFMRATASKAEIDKFQIHHNDVLLTKDSESPDDIGIAALVGQSLPGVICGYHLALVRSDEARLLGSYLCYYLQTKLVKNYFYRNSRGVTRFSLSKGTLENIEITLPQIKDQKRISDVLLDHDSMILNLMKKISFLKLQKAGLMDRLFNGNSK